MRVESGGDPLHDPAAAMLSVGDRTGWTSASLAATEKTNQNLDQPDILKGVGTAIEFGVPAACFTTQQPEAIAPT